MRSELFELQKRLPAYRGVDDLIIDEQDVSDIMKEVKDAHKLYAGDYDRISDFFAGGSVNNVSHRLFDFCMNHFPYEAESEHLQTSRSPAAMTALALAGAKFDCKHYAGWIAGVLDSLDRKGYPVDWSYRFASYNLLSDTPAHVFVVVKDKGKEIWIDPAPLQKGSQIIGRAYNDRLATPYYVTDKKPTMALKRMHGVDIDDRSYQLARMPLRASFIGYIPLDEMYPDQPPYYEQPADPAYYPPAPTVPVVPIMPAHGGNPNAFKPQGTGDTYSDPATSGISYTVNGQPLSFPYNSGMGLNVLPENLVVTYPEKFKGLIVPAALPKVIVIGNRIILLPKGLSQDVLRQNNYIWNSFLCAALLPLVRCYGQFPDIGDVKRLSNSGPGDTNLSQTILFDMDQVDVIDYVTMRTTVIPVVKAIPEGVKYFVDERELVFPPQNSPGVYPPPLPDIQVEYPASYRGLPVPANLPKPVYVEGKLQLSPNRVERSVFVENANVWAVFVTAVMAPLIQSYSMYPYAYNDNSASKLSDRIWFQCLAGDDVDDYLVPVDKKTWVGEALESVGHFLEDVGRGILKFVNAGSRLAFLGLVRINAFAWAYKLFIRASEPGELDKMKRRWNDLGGNDGVFQDAILLGCKNNPILGGGVKQWIEDAANQRGLGNGYDRPSNDTEIGEEVATDENGIPLELKAAVSGARIGVVGGDDLVYYLAAAAPIIAALGAFIKGIGGPKTDGIVDGVTGGINTLLVASGEDPILLGQQAGVPVTVTDPTTGQVYTINPQPTVVGGTFFDRIINFVKQNPIPTAVGALALVGAAYYFSKKKGKAS